MNPLWAEFGQMVRFGPFVQYGPIFGPIWTSGPNFEKLLPMPSILMDYVLRGAEIFALEICLENRTNFEEKYSAKINIIR